MRAVTLAVVCALTACIEPSLVQCPWGVTCPQGMVCEERLQQCVSQAQLTACDGLAEAAPCTYPGAAGGAFWCVEGVCVTAPRCGDGEQAAGEACDCGDGTSDLPAGCLRPNGDEADACRLNCTLPACGDGVLDSGEACDDGNVAAGDGCDDSCEFDGCGDGVRTDPEDCEGNDLDGATCTSLGYYGGTLGCRSICRFDTSGCGGRCGDGTIDPAEQCDSQQLGTTTCATLGFQEGTLACSLGCSYDTSGCSGYCGDGVRGGAEECDGLDTDGITCTSLGYAGGVPTCNPDCTLHILACDPGLCEVFVDDTGTTIAAADDSDCGSVSCSGFYQLVGDQSPTGTVKACYGREPITTLRCEGKNDCKDANTIDCSAQPVLSSAQVSCGVCQFVAGCTGATPGSCSPYLAGTKTSLCRDCDGTGAERDASDDVACGSILCSGWYEAVITGSPGPLATEACFGHAARRADRCSVGACRLPNTAATCDSEPLLPAPEITCGPCKRLSTGTCTGTTAGTCSNYPNGTLTAGSCGIGACVRLAQCQSGNDTCTPGTPAPDDLPDDLFVDANCDGIDGNESAAIFVAKTGSDSNPGTKALPKLTIQAAITAAAAAVPRRDVYISRGNYFETITLATDVSLYGGFDAADGWARSDVQPRIVGGPTAVIGTSISDVVLDHIAIRAGGGIGSGESSYGVRLLSASNVVVRATLIEAGRGASGTHGDDGTDGADGQTGADGEDGGGCMGTLEPEPGLGGTGCLSADGGAGGRTGFGYGADGQAGKKGLGPSGGQPGTGGSSFSPAREGLPALDVGDGLDGVSAMLEFNPASTTVYVSLAGVSGDNGPDGSGGGGGGGAAGTNGTVGCGSPPYPQFGGAGGGGGGGGCGGTGGESGGGGGGSFAVWVNAGSNITIAGNELVTDSGGDGGDGGDGGLGGDGGRGGLGGDFPSGTPLNFGAPGGRGGRGGLGGHGGGGGGGPTVGIVFRGCVSACTQTSNTFFLALPGRGGFGGTSAFGAPGLSANVHSL